MMRIKNKKSVFLLLSIIFVFCGSFFSSNYVYADCAGEDEIETSIFGCVKDDDQGCGVYMILNTILSILTVGVGVIAVLGIIISGIIYLTAGGNEQRVAKAKKRLFEIVIGLAAYVLLWAGLSWLMPGGVFYSGEMCETSEAIQDDTTSEPSNDPIPSNSSSENEESSESSSKNKESSDSSESSSKDNTTSTSVSKQQELNENALKFTGTSESGARTGPKSVEKGGAYSVAVQNYLNTYNDKNPTHQSGRACSVFVNSVILASGIKLNLKRDSRGYICSIQLRDAIQNDSKWLRVARVSGDKIASAIQSKGQAGDVIFRIANGVAKHSAMIVDKNGRKRIAEASVDKYYPALHFVKDLAYQESSLIFEIWRYKGN